MESGFLREMAGVRLVLVHLLAHLPNDTLKAISDGADTDFTTLEDFSGQGGEQWMAPYRQVVDEILARAAQIASQRGSAA
jgi:hypothetical protein